MLVKLKGLVDIVVRVHEFVLKFKKMVFATNKERGNAGLALAIAFYGANGYTVCLPLNDTQDYDMLVEMSGHVDKVQVKFTSYKSKYGIFEVALRSRGGNSMETYKTVKESNADILFVVTSEKKLYEIPISDITQCSSISMGKDKDKYLVEI